MDKRKILEQLLQGNTEPLIRAKEEAHKNIEVLFAHRAKNNEEWYTNISVSYRNGGSEQIEGLSKKDFEKLESQMVEGCLAIVFVDWSEDCPPIYRNEEDIPDI